MKNTFKFSILLLSVTLISGCVQHKQLVNFNEITLETDSLFAISNADPLRLQPQDLLKIDVYSYDLESAKPFNPDGGTNMMNMNQMGLGSGGNNMELITGYFIDLDGFIDFPVIGRVKVGGLTLEETRAKMLDAVKPYLNDASVSIRLLNYRITILGEVLRPGTQRLTNPRLTLLDALGLAGDLTPYANRNRILVIRESEGNRQFAYLDLQKQDIFTSPFYYLKQNDVIYVEPQRTKVATVQDPFFRFVSLTSVGLSIVTLIVTLTR